MTTVALLTLLREISVVNTDLYISNCYGDRMSHYAVEWRLQRVTQFVAQVENLLPEA